MSCGPGWAKCVSITSSCVDSWVYEWQWQYGDDNNGHMMAMTTTMTTTTLEIMMEMMQTMPQDQDLECVTAHPPKWISNNKESNIIVLGLLKDQFYFGGRKIQQYFRQLIRLKHCYILFGWGRSWQKSSFFFFFFLFFGGGVGGGGYLTKRLGQSKFRLYPSIPPL